MSISIQTNVNSVVAQENLRVTNEFQGKTIERLTSGYRINSSGDDAAGLAVANKFRSDIAELTQGVRNANDGLSQLQIVDSGLNNISKILDRLKTLATQSASSTFTGDRTILNNEYTSLRSEIDRQAANIGLGSGDTQAVRNNTAISVYIGGGSAQANSKIGIDLSAATNVVNAAGLLIDTTTVLGGTMDVAIGNVNLNTGGPFLANGSQTFRVGTEAGMTTVQVMGSTAGITGAEVVTQLNAGLVGTGVTFSINSTSGYLQASSAVAFSIAQGAAVGGGTAVAATIADTAAVFNTGKYNFDAGTLTAVTTAAQTITITPTGGTAINITLAIGTVEANYLAIKTALAGTAVDVVRMTDDLVFQSNTDFTISRGADVGTAGGGIGLANLGAPSAVGTVVDKLSSSDPTQDGLNALLAIATAVSRLGTVQGKVGTGQNKLNYSIQLAQSQLTGYAAAESRIRDADVAVEAANLTKVQVLTQASIAAMAQANSAPQQVLALLRG